MLVAVFSSCLPLILRDGQRSFKVVLLPREVLVVWKVNWWSALSCVAVRMLLFGERADVASLADEPKSRGLCAHNFAYGTKPFVHGVYQQAEKQQ